MVFIEFDGEFININNIFSIRDVEHRSTAGNRDYYFIVRGTGESYSCFSYDKEIDAYKKREELIRLIKQTEIKNEKV